MPKIDKVFTLEINPERFLQACSPAEVYELFILMQSPRYQEIIEEVEKDLNTNNTLEE